MNTEWTKNPNIKLALLVSISVLTVLSTDMGGDRLGWATLVTATLTACVTIKASVTDPSP